MKKSNLWNVTIAVLFLTVMAVSADAAETKVANQSSLNITAAPAGLASGAFNLGTLFKASDWLAAGPKARYSSYSNEGTSGTGFGFGIEGLISMSGKTFESGWVLLPFAEYASASSGSDSVSGMMAGADVGYWWYLDNGFNVGTGAGLQYLSLDMEKIGLGSISGVLPSFMAKVGYAF